MAVSNDLAEKHGSDGWDGESVVDMLVERAEIYKGVYETAKNHGDSEYAQEVADQIEEIGRIVRIIDESRAEEVWP